MQYSIILSHAARKDLHALERQVARRIVKKLRFYAESKAPLEFAERLTDFSEGEYRFHIGMWRVTFDAEYVRNERCVLQILVVDNRKDIYKKR